MINLFPTPVRPRTTMPSVAIQTSTTARVRCPKCGTTKKSAKRSCCARGGAWFKNCGDSDDSKFDHTWVEGMQACRGLRGSDSVESQEQVMMHGVGGTVYGLNVSQSVNATKLHTTINSADGVSSADVDYCDDCVRQTKLVVCVYGLFILCSSNFDELLV